jgi:nucleoid-associated protein EbfC
MAKDGFPKLGGGFINNLMKKAQQFQQQVEDMQKEAKHKEFTASAGGGAVVVTITGEKVLKQIHIKPEIVDPDDIEMLQNLILTAINVANKNAEEETTDKMGKLTGGLNIPGL